MCYIKPICIHPRKILFYYRYYLIILQLTTISMFYVDIDPTSKSILHVSNNIVIRPVGNLKFLIAITNIYRKYGI